MAIYNIEVLIFVLIVVWFYDTLNRGLNWTLCWPKLLRQCNLCLTVQHKLLSREVLHLLEDLLENPILSNVLNNMAWVASIDSKSREKVSFLSQPTWAVFFERIPICGILSNWWYPSLVRFIINRSDTRIWHGLRIFLLILLMCSWCTTVKRLWMNLCRCQWFRTFDFQANVKKIHDNP